jgi:hypothetical protein
MSQGDKSWFTQDNFSSTLRLLLVESNVFDMNAEVFCSRKMLVEGIITMSVATKSACFAW